MKRSELLKKAIEIAQNGANYDCNCESTRELNRFALELFLAEQKRDEGCAYEQIDDEQNIWKCDKCGEAWTFLEGGIVENNSRYCVACGLPIKRIITHGWDDDGNETTTITERRLTDGESK